MTIPGSTPAAPDPAALKAWLDLVDLDNASRPSAQERIASKPASYPADYIRHAIIGHHNGTRKIYSGIEPRNMIFAGKLNLQNFEIPFPLFFLGCTFDGAIDVRGAKAKTLGFTNCRLRFGADLRNVRIDGHVFMRGAFEAHGPVLLRDARIEGSLDLNGARFLISEEAKQGPFWKAASGECLGLSRAEARALLRNHAPPEETAAHRAEVAELPPQGSVNLRDMTVRSFRHDLGKRGLSAWPAKGCLDLDGFTYEHIDEAPHDILRKWLALQGKTSPASYFTLASVLQRQGRKDDAVQIRTQVRRNEVARYGWFKRVLAWIFYSPVDFGAKPTRALWWVAALLSLYLAVVAFLASNGGMTPSAGGLLLNPCYYGASTCKEDLARWQRVDISYPAAATRYVPPDYPPLSSVQYSLEAFVPVFDLGQRAYWEPSAAWARLLLAVFALLGLFLGSLFFAAVTGLLRPRES